MKMFRPNMIHIIAFTVIYMIGIVALCAWVLPAIMPASDPVFAIARNALVGIVGMFVLVFLFLLAIKQDSKAETVRRSRDGQVND